ncbi:MAG: hypothetical protein NVS1B4_20980 [Gemmatimonadaceae bacterium]
MVSAAACALLYKAVLEPPSPDSDIMAGGDVLSPFTTEPDTAMNTAPRTVLLVEDNPDNRFVYATVLRRFGFRVLEAQDGYEGIDRAQMEQPDLVLMDISMPILDGWDATAALKAHPDTRHIPVVALTAHSQPEDRERTFAAGCEDHITKPCSPFDLAEAVRRRLPERV